MEKPIETEFEIDEHHVHEDDPAVADVKRKQSRLATIHEKL
jgi:hypothetical protein